MFFTKFGRVKSSIIITLVSVIFTLILSLSISYIMINNGWEVNLQASILMSIIIPALIAFPLSLYTIGLHISLDKSKSDMENLYKESEKTNQYLEESKHELKQLFNNASVGLAYIDKNRVLIKANQKVADIFGYNTPDNMIGISMRNLHLSKDRFEEFGKKNFESLKYGEKINIEYQLKKKDGSKIWCEVSGKVLDENIPSDFSRGVLWTITNIDKRKQLEEYKNKTHARLEFALEGSVDGLWEWNITTNEVYLSPKWKRILGYEDNEIKNEFSSWENLVDPKDKNKTLQLIEKYLEDKIDSFETKFQMKHKDGHYIPILSRAKKQIDNNQEIRLIGTHFDLTEIVKHEKQQKKQQEIIFQQSKMTAMSEFVSNIAHHWRQPLSVISTSATNLEVQKEFGNLNDELIETTVKTINTHSQYLSKTIDDFGNFINEKKEEKLFDINESIETFLNLVDSSIQNNNIKIISSLEDDLKIFACPTKLIYCFVNLFNNAEEVLQDKETKLLFINSYKDLSNLIIEFKDNGGGIDNEHILRIFEPYFTTKHKSFGTGMGLSITYDLIVNGLNGLITVTNEEYEYNSKQEKGAQFTITIPLKVQ